MLDLVGGGGGSRGFANLNPPNKIANLGPPMTNYEHDPRREGVTGVREPFVLRDLDETVVELALAARQLRVRC